MKRSFESAGLAFGGLPPLHTERHACQANVSRPLLEEFSVARGAFSVAASMWGSGGRPSATAPRPWSPEAVCWGLARPPVVQAAWSRHPPIELEPKFWTALCRAIACV